MDGPLRRLRRFLGLDRNPLRRPVDRVEARIRLLLVAVLVAGGPALTAALATGVHDELAARAAVEQAESHRVTAVVTDSGHAIARPAAAPDPGGPGRPVRSAGALVRLPDGHAKRVRLSLPSDTTPGTRVPVWVNPRGQVVQQPLTTFDADFTAAAIAVLTPLMLAMTLWLIGAGTQAAATRITAVAWEHEWLLIDRRADRPGE